MTIAIVILMLLGYLLICTEHAVMKRFDVVRTYAYIQNPSPHAAEERNGGFVDAGNVLCADEQIAEQHQRDNSNSHNSGFLYFRATKLVKKHQNDKHFIAISCKITTFVVL